MSDTYKRHRGTTTTFLCHVVIGQEVVKYTFFRKSDITYTVWKMGHALRLKECRRGEWSILEEGDRWPGKGSWGMWWLAEPCVFCSKNYHVSLIQRSTLFFTLLHLKLGFI